MKSLVRYLPLAIMAAIAAALLAGGAGRLLTLDALAAHEQTLQAYVSAHRVLSVAAFVAVFALVTGASLPGALILTLTGGLLFGAWVGSVATVIGETAGAVLVYGVLHVSVGAALRERAEASGGRLKAMMDGVKAGAFGYILTLRLIPVAPFWLINVAAALAGAPLRAYAAATVIGIIPATVIYSTLGAGLGEALRRGERPNLDMMLRPAVLAPLAGLALLALAATIYQRRRAAQAKA